jgi:GTP pyrophosphokinase
VPLTYTLKSGERVEILTAKNGEPPNRNWLDTNLGYLKTARAISKVKSWFRNQQQAENINMGMAILEKECQRLGIKVPELSELTQHFKQSNPNTLLEFIGRGDINNRQLANALKIPEFDEVFNAKRNKTLGKSLISVAGIDNVQTNLAHCCQPVLGDEIIAYISHHKGITVHRRDCKNIAQLSAAKQLQLISVQWGGDKASHAVPIIVHAFNAQNILNDVSRLLMQAKIHIFSAALNTHPDFSASLNLTIQIENTSQLSVILNKLCQLPNIIEARRVT